MDQSQFYQFRSSIGKSVLVRRGEGAATITGGGARYNIVERPRRRSVVQWDGNDLYTMDVPVLFDGWDSDDSVEVAISILNQMWVADNVKALTPPPTVSVIGALPIKGATWVITKINYGDNVIWHTEGDNAFRMRQDATVSLQQFAAVDKFKVLTPTKISVPHVVKSGETLQSIANKHGASKKDIQKANGIRDGKTIKPGQTLRVPKTGAQSNYTDSSRDPGFASTRVVRRAWIQNS